MQKSQLVKLSVDQIAALTTAQAASLTTGQIALLTTDQIVAMGIEDLRSLTSAQVLALIEMYIAVVSVRRAEDITEALWETRVSPSTISNLNKKIYSKIEEWRN